MKALLAGLGAGILLIACGGAAGPDQPIDDTTPTLPPNPLFGSIPDGSGPVFVDGTDIIPTESLPSQVTLRVTGNLPTPCHQPAWEVDDDGTTITVTLASVADPNVLCAQVLEPFELSIPLGAFDSGRRDVTLNGEPVGDFEI